MKLTDLAIEGTLTGERFQLNRMHHGLNVVFDPSGGRRAEIVEFIRYLLFGPEGQKVNSFVHARPQFMGHADIARGPYRFRLSRQGSHHHALQVQGLDNASQIYSGDDLFGKLDVGVFNALYDVDFQNPDHHLTTAVAVLSNKLGVASHGRWASEAAYLQWNRDAETQRTRLHGLRDEVHRLESERSVLSRQVEMLSLQELEQKQRYDRELSELETALTQALTSLESNLSELHSLESQIALTQFELDRLANEVQYQPLEKFLDGLQVLYGQLDLLNGQRMQWTQLRDQIQAQRIFLRNEIETWSELPVASEEHPYHECDALIQRSHDALEKLNQQLVRPEAEAAQNDRTSAGYWRELKLVHSQIQSNLGSISSELSTQFRQLRHRTAAAAMKQLRENFESINENLNWLDSEHARTLSHLRSLDPRGAEAIENPSAEFQTIARDKGFFAAREKTIGAAPSLSGDHRAIYPDLDSPKQRLAQLQLRRGQLLETVAGREARVQELNHQKVEFLAARERVGWAEIPVARERLNEIQAALAIRNSEIEHLVSVVASNESIPPYVRNPILAQAGQFLARLTDNQWQSVAIDSKVLTVSNPAGPEQTRNTSQLSRVEQKCTLLALCLAANWWLNQQGLAVPMILQEVFSNLSNHQALSVASVLREFGLAGHQLIVFTDNEEVAELISQRLVAGTFSLHRAPRLATQVGTLPPITRDILNHFASAPAATTIQPKPLARTAATNPTTIPISTASQARTGESSWSRQASPLANLSSNVPTVYSDRSDFRTFPIYRPPLVATASETERSGLESRMISAMRQPSTRGSGPITEATHLQNVDLADSIHLVNLMNAGIQTIGDLLGLDPHDLPPDLEQVGLSPEQLDRWQAQAWLLTCVSSLTPSDSRVLVACGVTEPEQLETTSAETLLAKIQRYLASPDGRRFAPGDNRYQLERLQNWHRALKESRSQWRLGNGYGRRMRRRGWRQSRDSGNQNESLLAASTQLGAGSYFTNARRRDLQPGQGYFRQDPASNHAVVEFEQELPDPNSGDAETIGELEAPLAGGSRFFLNVGDSVANAPSIGPRTAERFTNIGVNTIADFLRMTAELMAEKINYKRLSADVIRQWQHQSRLVCQIPNLRGHDAQLLVGCGIIEPGQLASIAPKRLLELVGPFSETKEGLKIIRAGKKPDLAEVTDWISWAKQMRSLQAA